MPDVRVTNGDLQLEFKGVPGDGNVVRCFITLRGDEYYSQPAAVIGLNLWAIKEIHDWYERNTPPVPGPGSTDALRLRQLEAKVDLLLEELSTTAR
jgi:hypothetical protein